MEHLFEIIIVLIAVVASIVAVVVNRKSIAACVTITAMAFITCTVFLVLYNNVQKFESYSTLVKTTLMCSVILVIAMLGVTYIGVKMFFKKKSNKVVSEQSVISLGELRRIPGTNIMTAPVGIFGRKPIEKKPAPEVTDKTETATVTETTEPVKEVPVTETTKPVTEKTVEQKVVAPEKNEAALAALKRMLDKGAMFAAAGQFVLAEQMYVTYIQRCEDSITRADGELLLLKLQIDAGNNEKANEQLSELIGKLRSGEYVLTAEQKRSLAECKLAVMKMNM